MTQPGQPARTSRVGQILMIVLLALGVLLVVFFGLRTVRSYLQLWRTGLESGVTDVEAIRGWMTIPYIAAAYEVPEDYLFEQLGIPAEGNREKSLSRLNRQYGLGGRGIILEAVKEAVVAYQAEHPIPTRTPAP